MYKCDECDLLFEEPRRFQDDTGEVMLVCPVCLESYEEVHKCYDCGEYIPITQKLCTECQDTVIGYFKEKLHNDFNEAEIEYLNEFYDGECLE